MSGSHYCVITKNLYVYNFFCKAQMEWRLCLMNTAAATSSDISRYYRLTYIKSLINVLSDFPWTCMFFLPAFNFCVTGMCPYSQGPLLKFNSSPLRQHGIERPYLMQRW